jgi:oligopeptide transport system substrate-binding protein
VIGYSNSAYDTLMSIIASAADGAARMGCLHDAEELILSDYALAPLYTHGVTWEVRETLTGAYRDARGWFYFGCIREIPTA